jgi:hypothetical protein
MPLLGSRDRAVGTATGHGLNGRGFGVRVTVEATFSLLHFLYNDSGTHRASYPVNTGVISRGGKAAGA